jgi:ATP synthase mitochondrial F1 complex assembly factor 2
MLSKFRPLQMHIKKKLCRSLSSMAGFEQVHQTMAGRKRFYKQVTVERVVSSDDNISSSGGFKVCLDGRELKTPGRNPMHLPTVELGIVVANEWDAQTNPKRGIQPATMPFMQLASTAIDQVATEAGQKHAIDTVMAFLPTDTMLFFTTEDDRILLRKQKESFGPLLDWYTSDLGIELSISDGSFVSKLKHPVETYERIHNFVSSLDHFELTCLQRATLECKSLLMAIAILCGKLGFQDALVTSRLEEEFQIEIWGVVEGGHDMDRLNNEVTISSVVTFLHLYYDYGMRLPRRVGP